LTTRQAFTKEFKLDAVRLAINSGNVSAAARDLGITASALGIAASALARWKKQYEEEKGRASTERCAPGANAVAVVAWSV